MLTNATPETIFDLIHRRRTIKPGQMDSRPIPKSTLDLIVESANWAPTHGMTQPWRLSVFQNEARQELARMLSETYREITPPDEFKPNKFESFATNPTLAPAVIVIGMKRQPSCKISEIDEIAATACAVQNMHLLATSYGLGGFWSSNDAACSAAMRRFVGLEQNDRVLGLFYLGYPSCNWPDGHREPMSDRVRWVG